MALLQNLLEQLVDANLPGNAVHDVYLSLVEWIIETIEYDMKGFDWENAAKSYFHHIVYQMKTLNKVCRSISGI